MPLPIAVGGISLSSERLQGPSSSSRRCFLSCNDNFLKTSNNNDKNEQKQKQKHEHDHKHDHKHKHKHKHKQEHESTRPNNFLYDQRQSVTWAVCSRNEWQARVVISFYDGNNNDNDSHDSTISSKIQPQPQQGRRKIKRMVEIRIQISPLIQSLSSSAYRETVYHLELLDDDDNFYDNDNDDDNININMNDDNSNGNDNDNDNANNIDIDNSDSDSDSSFSADLIDSPTSSSRSRSHSHSKFTSTLQHQQQQQQPQAIFSDDRRKLIFLLFHPPKQRHQRRRRRQQRQFQFRQQSAVIVFQLRKPRATTTTSTTNNNQYNHIPLPSYIVTNNNNDNNLNPRNNSSSISSSSSNSNSNRTTSSSSSASFSSASPAVATHPKFVPCWGVTAICRVGDNNHTHNNGSGNINNNSNTTNNNNIVCNSCFLAVRNDTTLIWVDTRSVQVISTAPLCLPTAVTTNSMTANNDNNNNINIVSMKTSPISIYEKGLLVLVTSSENKNKNSNNSSSNSCIIVEWKLKSTTEVQKTSLRRASTGHVTFQSDYNKYSASSLSYDNNSEHDHEHNHDHDYFDDMNITTTKQQQRKKNMIRRVLPRRTVSEGPTTTTTKLVRRGNGDTNNPLQRTLQNVYLSIKNNRNNNIKKEKQQSQRQRKEYIDQLILQELRKNKRCSSSTTSTSKVITPSSSSPSLSLSTPTTSSIILPPFTNNSIVIPRCNSTHNPHLFVTKNLNNINIRRYSRRRSSAGDETSIMISSRAESTDTGTSITGRIIGGLEGNGVDRGTGIGATRMQVKFVSIWPPLPTCSSNCNSSSGEGDSNNNFNDQHYGSKSSEDHQSKQQTHKIKNNYNNNSSKQQVVIADVCFGVLSSVLCVVYYCPISSTTATTRNSSSSSSSSLGQRQRIAQVLTLNSKTGQLIPVVSLYLSSDQVEQASSVAEKKSNNGTFNSHNDDENKADKTYMDDGGSRSRCSNDDGVIITTHKHHHNRSTSTIDNNNTTPPIQFRQLYGIEHDPDSDSFLISSMFGRNDNYWIGCVWNWRSNSIGWMVQKEMTMTTTTLLTRQQLWSRLYFGRDPCYGVGSHLVYINASLRYNDDGGVDDDNNNNNDDEERQSNDNNNRNHNDNNYVIETKKRIVPLAVLTPANSLNPSVFTERCSLLLARNNVSFPCVSKKDADPAMLELDWKISALPLSYTISHGPPKIAIIGPDTAKSVAVSSTYGVCVLDTRHQQRTGYKWKQFGSPNEERSFSVVAMTWWEGNSKERKEHAKDDLLVAIIQTRNGKQFLSCWSSKRLDLMHQLMDTPDLEWKPGESQDPEPSWGIPLPKDIRVTNLSLLAEPHQDQSTGHSNKLRKAVVLLYSPDVASTECEYHVFRLQVFRNKISNSLSAEPYAARKPYFVMAYKIIQASIQNNSNWLGPVTSAFIAGAWFRFDLRKLGGKSTTTGRVEKEYFAVTLGVARTPGGMRALSITKEIETHIAILTGSEVSNCQISDVVPVHQSLSNSDRTPIFRFIWSIELLNGEVLCWSVPSVVTTDLDQVEIGLRSAHLAPSEIPVRRSAAITHPKGLCPPFLVCEEYSRKESERWIHGTLCEVGSVSDWALQSSSGCQFDTALGQVPQSKHGCVLRAGQSSQNFTRTQLGDIDSDIFSSNILEMNMYSQSPFLVTPPACVTSLFTLFLEAASIRLDLLSEKSSSVLDDQLQIIESQVQHRLSSSRSTDISIMALRLIVFRSLELIAKAHKKHSKDPSDISESDLELSQSLLSEIVDATRRYTSNLQFASLFLEIGRQIEPSNLEYLFPLPLPHKSVKANSTKLPSSDDDVLNTTKTRSVVDLFTMCIMEGSLAASASALPLLTSKAEARYYCGLLLDEAIDNFVKNTDTGKYSFDKTEEERRALGDFFRFGMKLEDADLWEASEVEKRRTSLEDISVDMVDQTDDPNETITPEVKRSLICNLSIHSSILNYIVPSSMLGESEKERTEEAIKREASSFIKRSLDDPILDFAMLPDWDDSLGSRFTNSTDISSVGGLVGDSLLNLLQSIHTDNNWKAMAAIAKMILQEGVEVPLSYNLFCAVAEKAQPLDILSLIPDSYDVNNGHEESMIAYIEEEVNTCSRQVTYSEANLIVDLALLVIDRILLLSLTDITDQTAMEMGLIFIVMVAGHGCGRSQTIKNTLEQYCLLNKCYKEATTAKDLTKMNIN